MPKLTEWETTELLSYQLGRYELLRVEFTMLLMVLAQMAL